MHISFFHLDNFCMSKSDIFSCQKWAILRQPILKYNMLLLLKLKWAILRQPILYQSKCHFYSWAILRQPILYQSKCHFYSWAILRQPILYQSKCHFSSFKNGLSSDSPAFTLLKWAILRQPSIYSRKCPNYGHKNYIMHIKCCCNE